MIKKTGILEKIVDLRHQLHRHPELSMQEVRTKHTLIDFLQKETALPVTDRGRWFYAYYDCGIVGAETIGFRADFDALPMTEENDISYASEESGVFHGCGHDGHSAALAGLALAVSREGAGKHIVFLFQHGEEIGGGAKECAGLIRELGISEIYAFHNMSGFPEKSIVVRKGVTQCASKGVTVAFQGKTAHASQPEDGCNPAKAISELTLAVENFQKLQEYRGLTMATIVQICVGSKNFGIAASKGELSLTLRAFYEEDMRKLEEKIKEKARTLAQRDGLQVTWQDSDVFPETVNEAGCADKVAEAARGLGLPCIEMEQPIRASEDFGYYLKECPGCMFYVGNGEAYPPIHTGNYDFNDRILETVIAIYRELIK